MTRRYSTDASWNILETEPVLAYAYDYANRLSAFTNSSTTSPSSWSYAYAPTGDRVFKTNLLSGSTQAFMYDGRDVVADYDVSGTSYARSRSYLQGLGVDSKIALIDPADETGGLFLDTDALGTVHQVLDGAVPDPNELRLTTAWGEDIRSGSATRYGFTQREHDNEPGESDLVYFRARHYSPRLGRFIQKDPLFGNSPFKHYLYAGCNPLLFLDPLGMQEFEANWFSDTLTFWSNVISRNPGRFDQRTVAAQRALGFTSGIGTGGQNVVEAGVETVKGTAQVVAHPVQTYNAAVENISQTIVAIDRQGALATLGGAAEGVAAEAEKDPSKFFARVGVGAMTTVAGGRLASALGEAVQGTRLGQAIVKLANTEIRFGKGAAKAGAAAEGEGAVAATQAAPEGAAPATKAGAKVFSKEKQALVDMAKTDKKAGGITRGDMKAYKELNEGLPDPFPADKVRGPEVHPLRTPDSKLGPGQQTHGHVGPVDHIPVKDEP